MDEPHMTARRWRTAHYGRQRRGGEDNTFEKRIRLAPGPLLASRFEPCVAIHHNVVSLEQSTTLCTDRECVPSITVGDAGRASRDSLECSARVGHVERREHGSNERYEDLHQILREAVTAKNERRIPGSNG